MADILLHDNRRDKAIEVLKNGVAVFDKGIKDLENRGLENGAPDAKEISRLKGGIAELDWHLANFYLDAKHLADAADCMRTMREYEFSPVKMAFLDARVLYAKEDWKAALEGFEKVRPQLKNDSPQLIASLDCWTGDCYVQQGNPDQAVAAFRRVLSVDKTFFKARDGIARIFINDGKFKEAADEYGEAVLANPGDVDAWLALARARVDLNLRRSPAEQEWDKVEELLRQVESIAPGNVQIMSLFAEMRLAQGRAKDADDLLKALREAAPDGVPFAVAQANLAAQRGELDQARKILDEAQMRLDKARDAILVEARQANLDQVKKARLDAARQANLDDQVRLRLARVPILLRDLGSQAAPQIEKLAAAGATEGSATFSPRRKRASGAASWATCWISGNTTRPSGSAGRLPTCSRTTPPFATASWSWP